MLWYYYVLILFRLWESYQQTNISWDGTLRGMVSLMITRELSSSRPPDPKPIQSGPSPLWPPWGPRKTMSSRYWCWGINHCGYFHLKLGYLFFFGRKHLFVFWLWHLPPTLLHCSKSWQRYKLQVQDVIPDDSIVSARKTKFLMVQSKTYKRSTNAKPGNDKSHRFK